ncbi:MAG: glycosyltransferase family 39 protein [Ignavibacteriaceae bacterium]
MKNYKTFLLLSAIILAGILLRIYFYVGHIFSDDAYYSYLSYTLLKGDFAKDYLGYPIFPLRITYLSITALAYKIFGINECATIVFPFLLSIANMILTYKMVKLFTGNEIASILSLFLITFFPTDIIFATIDFVDLPNSFFINLGIYFLYKSYRSGQYSQAMVGGFCFFISMQIKENIYYVLIPLLLLFIYLFIKKNKINFQILIGLGFILLNTILEGFIYLYLNNDFFYRLTILKQNYIYSFYDFFPYTAERFTDSKNYWKNLFYQIFIINLKSILLRRFYLFTPFIASIKSIFNIKKKEYSLLTYWFLSIVFLLIAFTTSFTEFKPLDLQRSWYIYPMLMPTIILTALLIYNLKKLILYPLLILYMTGGIIMCNHYKGYFDVSNKDKLKSFLSNHREAIIYTDHFTKYSVDLIRNYSDPDDSRRIYGDNFNLNKVKSGNWILYNRKHIEELELQKYKFPDFSILKSDLFKEVTSFGAFVIYEKTSGNDY